MWKLQSADLKVRATFGRTRTIAIAVLARRQPFGPRFTAPSLCPQDSGASSIGVFVRKATSFLAQSAKPKWRAIMTSCRAGPRGPHAVSHRWDILGHEPTIFSYR